MKESFVFYKSFNDAIACIEDDAERLKAYEVLMKYAIYGEKEDVGGVAGVVLNMAIPTIDANNRRYEKAKENGKFGKLGGRPKKVQEEPKDEADEAPEAEEEVQDETQITEMPAQEEKTEKQKKPSEPKTAHGEHGNVKLTEAEFERLCADYGEEETQEAIDYLDQYIAEKAYKSKSHNIALRRWVFDAVKERKAKQIQFQHRPRNFVNIPTRSEDMNALERQLVEN